MFFKNKKIQIRGKKEHGKFNSSGVTILGVMLQAQYLLWAQPNPAGYHNQ